MKVFKKKWCRGLVAVIVCHVSMISYATNNKATKKEMGYSVKKELSQRMPYVREGCNDIERTVRIKYDKGVQELTSQQEALLIPYVLKTQKHLFTNPNAIKSTRIRENVIDISSTTRGFEPALVAVWKIRLKPNPRAHTIEVYCPLKYFKK